MKTETLTGKYKFKQMLFGGIKIMVQIQTIELYHMMPPIFWQPRWVNASKEHLVELGLMNETNITNALTSLS